MSLKVLDERTKKVVKGISSMGETGLIYVNDVKVWFRLWLSTTERDPPRGHPPSSREVDRTECKEVVD